MRPLLITAAVFVICRSDPIPSKERIMDETQFSNPRSFDYNFEDDLRKPADMNDIYDELVPYLPGFVLHKNGKDVGYTRVPIVTRKVSTWSTPAPRNRKVENYDAWTAPSSWSSSWRSQTKPPLSKTQLNQPKGLQEKFDSWRRLTATTRSTTMRTTTTRRPTTTTTRRTTPRPTTTTRRTTTARPTTTTTRRTTKTRRTATTRRTITTHRPTTTTTTRRTTTTRKPTTTNTRRTTTTRRPIATTTRRTTTTTRPTTTTREPTTTTARRTTTTRRPTTATTRRATTTTRPITATTRRTTTTSKPTTTTTRRTTTTTRPTTTTTRRTATTRRPTAATTRRTTARRTTPTTTTRRPTTTSRWSTRITLWTTKTTNRPRITTTTPPRQTSQVAQSNFLVKKIQQLLVGKAVRSISVHPVLKPPIIHSGDGPYRGPTYNCRVLNPVRDGKPSTNTDKSCVLIMPGFPADNSCRCTYEVAGRDDNGCATGFVYTCTKR